MKRLEHLDLLGTEVTDACIDNVIAIKSLESINLQNTDVSDDGVARIKRALNGIVVEHGSVLISFR